MLYTIEWIENGVAAGKETRKCTLKDLAGLEAKNVTIWSEDRNGVPFPGFAALTLGGQVEGDLVAAKDPKYGPTLYAPRPKSAGGGGAGKTAMMEKTMEKKGEMISQAQDKKGEAIQMASVMRDAVLITLEESKHMTGGESYEEIFQKRFRFWRAWLTNRWDDKAEDIAVPFD